MTGPYPASPAAGSTALAAEAAQPQLQPAPAPQQAPHLRLVPPARDRRLARLTRVLSLLTLAGFLAVLFGLAAFHASLAEGQYELDEMQNELTELEAQRAELQLTVQQLEAPERIASMAAQQGLASPELTVDLYTSVDQVAGVLSGQDGLAATPAPSPVPSPAPGPQSVP